MFTDLCTFEIGRLRKQTRIKYSKKFERRAEVLMDPRSTLTIGRDSSEKGNRMKLESLQDWTNIEIHELQFYSLDEVKFSLI